MDTNGTAKINIYGAFDRYNYGDLLFPIIIQKALNERLPGLTYSYYGLIDSDLSKFGGVQTQAIRCLIRDSTSNGQKSVIIVAGGEVLSTSMFFLNQCLMDNVLLRKLFEKLRVLFGAKFAEFLCQKKLAPKLDFPFILDKNLFKENTCIMYNTVGGKLPDRKKELSHQYLRQTDFISVRDQKTLDEIKETVPEITPSLFPDSATIMSKYFSKTKLYDMVNTETKRILNSLRKGYICFQISSYSYGLAPETIKNQLHQLSKMTDLPILLLPLGWAPWHSDQYALNSIKKDANFHCIIAEKPGIFDIMSLIANSNLFIGTSLHGLITSMSFSIPYLSIGPHVHKLKRYLQTWSNSKFNKPFDFNDIAENGNKALSVDKQFLDDERIFLIRKTEDNFKLLAKTINNFIYMT